MIYTLTLNPAVDYVMEVDALCPGGTNRARGARLHFGGKGVNVSAVLKELGVETVALGFVAGFTGEALERDAARRGIPTDFIRLSEGHTRINVKLRGEVETELNAPGPTVTEADITRLFGKLEQVKVGDTLVLSGSVPPGLASTVYADILSALAGRGIRFAVDAAGELLRHTLPHRPFLIKPNRSELEGLCGRALTDDDQLTQAARTLQAQGAQNVLVSLGPDGALLLDGQGRVHRRRALPGKAVNTIGAGDSMLAGFFAGLEQNVAHSLSSDGIPGRDITSLPGMSGLEQDIDCALDLAVAAGCATAFSPCLATRADISVLYPEL